MNKMSQGSQKLSLNIFLFVSVIGFAGLALAQNLGDDAELAELAKNPKAVELSLVQLAAKYPVPVDHLLGVPKAGEVKLEKSGLLKTGQSEIAQLGEDRFLLSGSRWVFLKAPYKNVQTYFETVKKDKYISPIIETSHLTRVDPEHQVYRALTSVPAVLSNLETTCAVLLSQRPVTDATPGALANLLTESSYQMSNCHELDDNDRVWTELFWGHNILMPVGSGANEGVIVVQQMITVQQRHRVFIFTPSQSIIFDTAKKLADQSLKDLLEAFR
jgi:hypothetical protein